jgi:hypothetical protein
MLDHHIERFERLSGPFFAVHQKRRGTFLADDRQMLKWLWTDRRLLSEEEADELVGPAASKLPRAPFWWRWRER